MSAVEKEKVNMNTTGTANQRLVTILLVLLILLVALLFMSIVAGFFMMGGGMIGWGSMMGVNGQTVNNMISACVDIMRSFQKP